MGQTIVQRIAGVRPDGVFVGYTSRFPPNSGLHFDVMVGVVHQTATSKANWGRGNRKELSVPGFPEPFVAPLRINA